MTKLLSFAVRAFGRSSNGARRTTTDEPITVSATERRYLLERVDDAAVVQLYADGFGALPLREKTLIWHLYQAAIAGRDIFYDQRYAHSLEMRDVLEAIITHAGGVDAATRTEIVRYTKLFWINSGPYNNLTARKFVLTCTPEAFAAAAHAAERAGASFPLANGESLDPLLARLHPMFFDPAVDPMVTAKTPPPGTDILAASANNLYVGVTMKDLEGFHERFALNSRLVKRNGHLVNRCTAPERALRRRDRGDRRPSRGRDSVRHRADGRRAPRADQVLPDRRTGRSEAYDIAWVKDKASPVDTINGFIEVYLDARGIKGAWEAIVFYVNREKTEGIQKLAAAAQWFEDRMPWDPKYRKQGVHGITANAIDVVIETGDSGPVTPSASTCRTIRRCASSYGSKSVSLANVNDAYDKSHAGRRSGASSRGRPRRRNARRKWGAFAGELTTNMHEVIGHGSGKVAERLKGNPQRVLKEQYSALEEARADLVALYFLPDPKLVELGLVGAEDHAEVVRAEYEHYARNALVQLRRVREGTQIEEDHMRNRQMIVRWLMANTNAIEKRRPRRQDLLRRRRRAGVPRRRRPAARRSAAHQDRRATTRRPRHCSRPTASISIRRCATRWSPASRR